MMKTLVISNKSDVTSDFIVKKLKERGIGFYRFNTEDLTKTCSLILNFSLKTFCLKDLITGNTYDLKAFKSVYFRRPEITSFEDLKINRAEKLFSKYEFAYSLEGIYKILKHAFWISPVYAIREAENKIYQLELAQSIGFNIPNTIITDSYEDFKQFYHQNQNDCVIKPIKSGHIEDGKRSKVVFTSILKDRPVFKKRFGILPNLIQSQIHKQGDIRVTVVGEKAFPTLIHSQENPETLVDWRRGEKILEHTKINLPSNILDKCINLTKRLNLKFGAIDLILDRHGEYIFLEINPNGQWAWIEKQTGYQISDEITNLLEYETN